MIRQRAVGAEPEAVEDLAQRRRDLRDGKERVQNVGADHHYVEHG
jgi:hypothetical protein